MKKYYSRSLKRRKSMRGGGMVPWPGSNGRKRKTMRGGLKERPMWPMRGGIERIIIDPIPNGGKRKSMRGGVIYNSTSATDI